MPINKRSGSAFPIYSNLAVLAKDMEYAVHSLKKMEDALVYWASPSNGFMFNRKAANHLANYLKMQLSTQEIMVGLPSLKESWAKRKIMTGLFSETGMATGAMLESITALDQGYGKYRVGIRERVNAPFHPYIGKTGKTYSRPLGTLKKVIQYAIVFEKGSSLSGQQARPWFIKGVRKWIKTQVPGLLKPFLSEFNEPLKTLHKATHSPGSTPKIKPEDILWVKGNL